jgi:hypothetical protein
MIKEEHKAMLRELGLEEKDFGLFNGKDVAYEFDEKRGIRIYDPYYATSYDGYIEVDGWSCWTSSRDTFMQNIQSKASPSPEGRQGAVSELDQEVITRALKKKFGSKDDPTSET